MDDKDETLGELPGRAATAYQQEKMLVRSQGLSVSRRFGKDVEEMIIAINWLHIAFKILAFSYLALVVWLAWMILPLPGHWSQPDAVDFQPQLRLELSHYFSDFAGQAECGIRATDLYDEPAQDDRGFYPEHTFCRTRGELLNALSNGGRIGFDAPYTPQGCHYRWFTPEEICFILERFDNLVFVGDESVRVIYSGLMILLRQDLATGAVSTREMDAKAKEGCHCRNQFVKQDCSKHFVTNQAQLSNARQYGESPLICNPVRHVYLESQSADVPVQTVDDFNARLLKDKGTKHQAIPIIHGLSPSAATIGEAQTFITRILDLADSSDRRTPMLWIGPTAAGHIDIRGRKGNQEIWEYDRKTAHFAAIHDVEVLGMWNLTVQATSWDGMHFGEKVAITQAMMVLNWLSRLPSS